MKAPKVHHQISEKGNILFIEADQNYSVFHLESGAKMVSGYTLKFHIKHLDHKQFIRINRSILVSRGFLKSVKSLDTMSYAILQDGRQIPIPRRRLKDFQEQYQA